MTDKGPDSGTALTTPEPVRNPLVVRSDVPPGKPYGEYKPYLRRDFVFSCAYCTMSEAEAQAIRMTIDHYEPRKLRPDLENDYQNLMYACDECNLRKGDRRPPDDARAAGFRFFRPDNDARGDHFERTGVRVEPKSNVGTYSIAALDLNRASLRRLREIRERLTKCDRLASEGVLGLKNFHIDQLPPTIRGSALRAIKDAAAAEERIVSEIDGLLASYAQSPLIGPDPESETNREERKTELKSIEALFAGRWRAPRKQRR